jgi:bacillolysin
LLAGLPLAGCSGTEVTNVLVHLAIILVSILITACAGTRGPLLELWDEQLIEDVAGDRWRVSIDNDEDRAGIAVATRRSSRAPVASILTQAPRIAHEALLSNTRIFGPAMTAANLELRDVTADALGGARVRFALRVEGLRIDGGDLVVAVSPDGGVRAVAGWFPELDALSAIPTVAPLAAERAALERAARSWPDDVIEVEGQPELIALPRGTRLHPCWRIIVAGSGADGAFRREIYVEASSGSVVHEREGLLSLTAKGSGLAINGQRRLLSIEEVRDGSFRLVDLTRRRGIHTTTASGEMTAVGAVLVSQDRDRWDEGVRGAGAAVDAHANAAIVFDYLAQHLGRDSWDGRGGRISLVVHYGEAQANAFWDGRRAIFGDGDGDVTRPFSGGLDVVAHELFHGVVQEEVGLVYERQPGSLNESLSDVFGILVEGQNWLVGEDVSDVPLRDVEAPWTLEMPAHMVEYVVLPATPANDMGGVHVNSTIPSHAAFLLAEGGTHATSDITVQGIGVPRMRAIWWRAMSNYLAPRARFHDFAEATRTAAEDLHGADSPEAESVIAAWRAVGVLL